MAPISNSYITPPGGKSGGGAVSAFFFLLDGFADDVGHVGVAFLFLLDKGGIVQAFVDLDFFVVLAASRRRALGRSRLLALLLGLGVVKRDKFGFRGLRHDLGNL